MKFKDWLFLVSCFIICTVMLTACQSSNPIHGQQTNKTKAVETKVNQPADSGKLPDYFPDTFPLPQDADINTSHSSIIDGKKTALLIFTTQQDMPFITKLYKDYFKTQNLEDSSYTMDNQNIIIQGSNMEKEEDWSMIGGTLSDRGIELTVTWSEL